MSKKKGLSVDEKYQKLKELFHESVRDIFDEKDSSDAHQKDVYTLKLLEPLAYKQKGIVSQSVKEVLESLVADHIVGTDKIGTSTYFWSFPSSSLIAVKNKQNDLKTEAETLKRTRATLEMDIQTARVGREDTMERTTKLARIDELEKERRGIREELRKYAEMDPEIIDAMEADTKEAKEAVNRWTDNLFQLRKTCVKNGMDNAQFNSRFEITEEVDYV